MWLDRRLNRRPGWCQGKPKTTGFHLASRAWLALGTRDRQSRRFMMGRDAAEVAPDGSPRVRPVRLSSMPANLGPLYVRDGAGTGSDRDTLWEIFFWNTYRWRQAGRGGFLPETVRTVVDCGANIGLFAADLIRRGAALDRYLAIEADPGSFHVLEKQLVALGLAECACRWQQAVGAEETSMRFSTGRESVFHGLSEDGDLEVKVRPLTGFLDEAGVDSVDLLKIDIEGGERFVIPTAPDWADRVKRMVIELHDGLDTKWLREHLEPLGYEIFEAGDLFEGNPSAVQRSLLA